MSKQDMPAPLPEKPQEEAPVIETDKPQLEVINGEESSTETQEQSEEEKNRKGAFRFRVVEMLTERGNLSDDDEDKVGREDIEVVLGLLDDVNEFSDNPEEDAKRFIDDMLEKKSQDGMEEIADTSKQEEKPDLDDTDQATEQAEDIEQSGAEESASIETVSDSPDENIENQESLKSRFNSEVSEELQRMLDKNEISKEEVDKKMECAAKVDISNLSEEDIQKATNIFAQAFENDEDKLAEVFKSGDISGVDLVDWHDGEASKVDVPVEDIPESGLEENKKSTEEKLEEIKTLANEVRGLIEKREERVGAQNTSKSRLSILNGKTDALKKLVEEDVDENTDEVDELYRYLRAEKENLEKEEYVVRQEKREDETVPEGNLDVNTSKAENIDKAKPEEEEERLADSGLTQEAEELLNKLDKGSSAPAFISENLRKIALDNGIEVGDGDKPEDVIENLRSKRKVSEEISSKEQGAEVSEAETVEQADMESGEPNNEKAESSETATEETEDSKTGVEAEIVTGEKEIALSEAREAFLSKYKDYLQTRKLREQMGISKGEDKWPEELKELKKKHTEAKLAYARALYDAKREELFENMPKIETIKTKTGDDRKMFKDEDIEAATEMNELMDKEYFPAQIFNEVSCKEQEEMQNARIEALSDQQKGKIRQGLEWYSKRSKFSKAVIGTVAVTGALVGGGFVGGATVGVYAAQRFARSLAGLVFGAGAANLVGRRGEKKITEKTEKMERGFEKNFGIAFLKRLEEIDKERQDGFKDIEGMRKNLLYKKAGAALIVGMLVGGGAQKAMAVTDVFGAAGTAGVASSEQDLAETANNRHPMPAESELNKQNVHDWNMFGEDKAAVDNLYKDTAGGHPAPENIPIVSDVADAVSTAEPYTAEKGDRLWNIIAEREGVKGLEEGRQSNAIANTIAEIKKSPEALRALGFEGPDDIDNIELGQKMDISKIDEILGTVKIDGESIVEHAQGLDEETAASIDANDDKIAEWRAQPENQNIPLTEQRVEEILHGDADTLESVDIVEQEASTSGEVDNAFVEQIRQTVEQTKSVEGIVGEYNKDLFKSVDGGFTKNKDLIAAFNVKGNLVDVKLIITPENKIAVDGYGYLNWPDGAKPGGLFTSRHLETFADLNEENMKEALKFLNEGKFDSRNLVDGVDNLSEDPEVISQETNVSMDANTEADTEDVRGSAGESSPIDSTNVVAENIEYISDPEDYRYTISGEGVDARMYFNRDADGNIVSIHKEVLETYKIRGTEYIDTGELHKALEQQGKLSMEHLYRDNLQQAGTKLTAHIRMLEVLEETGNEEGKKYSLILNEVRDDIKSITEKYGEEVLDMDKLGKFMEK